MCGISACFDLRTRTARGDTSHTPGCEKRRAHLLVQLDNSAEAQRFRGPDAKGTWVSPDNGAGLGHVRLSTRDLSSAGHQPMHSSDQSDDIHLVVNGELYYDPELRDQLAAKYRFQSTSDSEMAIALYKIFGVDFISHLRGEFSLVIYDGKTRTLVAARDRFGVKPLHYAVSDGRLLIATQAKGVVELLEDKRSIRWDPHCLAQAGGHYGSRSLIEGIKRFPPGHMLVVKQNEVEHEELTFRSYYRSVFPANTDGADDRPTEGLIQQLRDELLEAVRLRLVLSDVPVGILLSGGVDSSAVAGMAAHLSRKRLEESNGNAPPLPTCFTIAFPDDAELDESTVAQRTAEHLGLPIEKVVVSEQTLVDEFDESCWRGEALMWDLQHIAKKALSRHISGRGLKVVLNGDGSDELFAGYPFFAADRLIKDDLTRAPDLQSVDTDQREEIKKEHLDNLSWFGAETTKRQNEHPAAKALCLPPAFCNLAVPRHDSWLVPEVRNLGNPFDGILDCFSTQEVKEMQNYHPLHRSMLAWRKTVLPNMVISAISDGAEMSHGVESRPPFLDHIVADLANNLPVDLLVHLDTDGEATEKWIFREAVKPYVTDEVYKKRKQAFAAPFKWKKNGPLYHKLNSLITRDSIEGLGFAEWEICKDIVDRAFEKEDQLIFRNAIWLAQLISIGKQFGVQKLSLESASLGRGVAKTELNGSGSLQSCTNDHNGPAKRSASTSILVQS